MSGARSGRSSTSTGIRSCRLGEWRERLVDAGWACPGLADRVVRARALDGRRIARGDRELASSGVPGPPAGVGLGLAAPTILEHGSDDVKRRFLRPIATGEHPWCQLFSEPGYGSDLAGLVTRADPRRRRVGRQRAEAVDHERPPRRLRPARRPHRLGRAEAPRTHVLRDRHAPARHRGAPGATDERARLVQRGVPHRREGPRRRHHRRSRRGMAGGPRDTGPRAAARPPSAADRRSIRAPGGRSARRRPRADELMAPYDWYPQRAGRAELAAPLAASLGRSRDPVVRQALARLESIVRTAEWTNRRAQAARVLGSTTWRRGLAGQAAREPHRQGVGRRARARRRRPRDARRARRACSTA